LNHWESLNPAQEEKQARFEYGRNKQGLNWAGNTVITIHSYLLTGPSLYQGVMITRFNKRDKTNFIASPILFKHSVCCKLYFI
jgi:hypothetical protein